MFTDDVVLSPHWSLIVPAGDEFLLTLDPDQAAQIRVAILNTTGLDGVVADLTTLAALVGPQDGDRYLVSAINRVYVWDADGGEAETGAWVAMELLDEVVTVRGHALSAVPKLGQMESLNRALIGPGHVVAKSVRDSLQVALTTWTLA